MNIDNQSVETVSFRVDAGLIDRLGKELVGRAETAVSELIKNSYDADATNVEVYFINTNNAGGVLRIVDNGLGMTLSQVMTGFMTISSTDKIHNPKSPRFSRNKAGRKGIGRFATQFLGERLTIITQTKELPKALQISIDWSNYTIDQDISQIQNPLKEVEKIQEEGTILEIGFLRESWNEKSIERIFRYVSELLQPNFLSDRSSDLGIANQKDESFNVQFIESIDGQQKIIANPNKMLFEKSVAIIEGYVDKVGDGFCSVKSEGLHLEDDDIIPILNTKEEHQKFKNIGEVHFKAYYFIYDKAEYYDNKISKLELNGIKKLSVEQGGVKLYRNGFRVLPYGEQNNDWLGLDKRYNFASGVVNIPFGNRNLFGFVEIIDTEGQDFQETASREGLIENNSFIELRDFVAQALRAGQIRIRHGVEKIKTSKKNDKILQKDKLDDRFVDFENLFNKFIEGLPKNKESANFKEISIKFIKSLKEDVTSLLEELGMLRVLAGLGLTIGEFTHEIIQFSPSINGDLSVLNNQKLDSEGINSIENLKRTIKLFTSYTSYFNATVSANVSRELRPQQIDLVINQFNKIIESDIEKSMLILTTEFYGFDLFTLPMHASEWSSILFNLYTNSKKAIKRANINGKIKLVAGKENSNIYIEFSDNGDGIPEINKEKIFSAFFTTSAPVGFEASNDELLTGTGLGLKIVKDIIQNYGGTIEIIAPETNYSTCFRIEIPMATKKQLENYGY